MISIKIDDAQVKAMLQQFPKEASRAAEIAIDKTAMAIKEGVRQALPQVFDRPTPFTMNSLKVERTRNHNMVATVWFKEPDRMGQHYLVPNVEGGRRKLKGFERALGGLAYMPSKHAKLDQYGNMPYGIIVQLLSVLGRAEYVAGYTANISGASKKRNRKPRDYVWLPKGSGKLPPGIYQREQTGVGFGAKTKKTLPFGEYQRGQTKGRFSSAIRARGLRPVLIQTNKGKSYTKRLPFYEISRKVYDRVFLGLFNSEFIKRLR